MSEFTLRISVTRLESPLLKHGAFYRVIAARRSYSSFSPISEAKFGVAKFHVELPSAASALSSAASSLHSPASSAAAVATVASPTVSYDHRAPSRRAPDFWQSLSCLLHFKTGGDTSSSSSSQQQFQPKLLEFTIQERIGETPLRQAEHERSGGFSIVAASVVDLAQLFVKGVATGREPLAGHKTVFVRHATVPVVFSASPEIGAELHICLRFDSGDDRSVVPPVVVSASAASTSSSSSAASPAQQREEQQQQQSPVVETNQDSNKLASTTAATSASAAVPVSAAVPASSSPEAVLAEFEALLLKERENEPRLIAQLASLSERKKTLVVARLFNSSATMSGLSSPTSALTTGTTPARDNMANPAVASSLLTTSVADLQQQLHTAAARLARTVAVDRIALLYQAGFRKALETKMKEAKKAAKEEPLVGDEQEQHAEKRKQRIAELAATTEELRKAAAVTMLSSVSRKLNAAAASLLRHQAEQNHVVVE